MGKTVPQAYQELLAEMRRPRWDRVGESRYMTHDSGYVMVRRPGRMPYILTQKEWLALPYAEEGKLLAKQYRAALYSEQEGRE